MSGPYLKRGESILLTTDRVSINSLLYEALLTTRHLILVDIRYDQFLPQKIPLSTILSVKGGKIATGEPVITLIFSDNDSRSGSGPMVLIFTQQPGEQRKRERDEWLKNLMANIVSVRQEIITPGSPPVDVEYGIRPASRRPGAHEKITPYTTTVDISPSPVELTILPDESDSLEVPEEDQESAGKEISESDTQPEITYSIPEYEENPPDEGTDGGSASTLPQNEPEEIVGSHPVPMYEGKTPDTAITEVSADGEISAEPESNAGAEKPFALILLEAVKSLHSSEPKKELPEAVPLYEPPVEETAVPQHEEPESPELPVPPEPEVVGLPEAVPVSEPPVEETAVPQQEEPESPELPTYPKPEVVGLPEAVPVSEPPVEETAVPQQEEPESPALPIPPKPEVIESPTAVKEDSALSGTIPSNAEDIVQPGQEPPEQAIPQIPKSPPPTHGTGSKRQRLILVTTIILIILGIGIAAFVYSHNFAPVKQPIPIPTPSQQQIPLTQISVQQTTPQQTPLPQTTVLITEAPTPVVIPPDGIWVRVVYSGNYDGRVGNPGSMQSVKGSGDQIYKIKSDGLVQLQINKKDNTGNQLMVEIYRNGELMTQRVRSAPMGSIELLIDAKTGNPPGASTVLTNETNQTGSSGERVMYF